MRQDSRAVHAGREPGAREPLAPPIVQASVHVFEDLEDYDAVASGAIPGHVYGRNSNENVAWLESAVADLEGAAAGVATASGMAAIYVAILALAPPAEESRQETHVAVTSAGSGAPRSAHYAAYTLYLPYALWYNGITVDGAGRGGGRVRTKRAGASPQTQAATAVRQPVLDRPHRRGVSALQWH